MITVLDLSHWQTITDWAAIRAAGVAGMIHKFSQGAAYCDPTYEARAPAARAAGLLWGRYHFGTSADVHAQVDNFLDGWTDDEALALDWEDHTESQMTALHAMVFVALVEQRTGVLPILYSGNTLKEHAASGAYLGALLKCRLWIAQYGPHAVLPKGWDRYWLWQQSDKGDVPGITGPVDTSRYDGTEAELRASWAPAPTKPPVLVA